MPNLPTGPYRLEVSLQGFRTYVQTGIVLQVGATPTINAVLGRRQSRGVGDRWTPRRRSWTCRAPASRKSSTTSASWSCRCRGARSTNLIVLAGAAVNTGDVSGQRNRSDSVAISVAGGLRTGVAYVLDGAMHNDPYDNTNMPFPFPDALQEFTRGDERAVGAERHALRRVGQRGDQVGHQRLSRQRVRVPARQRVQRDRPVRARRRGRQEGETMASFATSSAARSAGRSCGTSCSSSAGIRGRSSGRRRPRSSPSCRRRRCWPATSPAIASPACNAGRQVALARARS